MEIVINSEILVENNVTISEFLYLQSLHEGNFSKDLFKIIDKIEEDSLQKRGFIKITTDGVVLRSKAINLFESPNLFLKFLNTFPIKTPSGRFLSPLRDNTMKSKKLEAKWNKLFKSKPHLEEKAIKVLEAELKWRKRNNSLDFMKGIESWLNQGEYENLEYLLEEDKENYNDFM